MRTFAYTRPERAEDAMQLVTADHDASYLAGGTNLVDLMKLGVAHPGLLVDITALDLEFVTELPDGGLRIGAGTSNSDVAASPLVRRRYPMLAQAILSGASGQLRNRATVGGNLLQRNRCLYFQDVSKPCNKRSPGSGCPARAGEHHNLAILGASEQCIATNPSDMAVALSALDAVIHVREPAGRSEIPLADFYLPPCDRPDRETALPHGALITAVDLPALPFARRSAYRKVRERASYAFANGSVAAAVDVADGTVRDIRLSFGAVAPMPWRARLAEETLRGQSASPEAFRDAAARELAAARPLRDNAYKINVITAATVQTLSSLTGVTP
jgi:xanthine dehydrogenase YagS FAD-binding subunit